MNTYDEKSIEEEEYSFDTAAFEMLKYMTEHDNDSEFSKDEEDDEENNIYDGYFGVSPLLYFISF